MKSIILQVEDDPNDVFLLQHAMKRGGVTNPVQVVGDGQEAIDYLSGTGQFADREKFPYPTLLLLDLKLPHVMGLDVLRWLRTQPSRPLIILILTASAEDADIIEAYRLGANAFLTKPSEATKLEAMVRAIDAFWLTHNTLPPERLGKSFQAPYAQQANSYPRTTPLGNGQFNPARPVDTKVSGNGNGQIAGQSSESAFDRLPTQSGPAGAAGAATLTTRQERVLQLIGEGFSNKEIASIMSMTVKTLEKEREALMEKLDIHETAGLTRYAVTNRLGAGNAGPG